VARSGSWVASTTPTLSPLDGIAGELIDHGESVFVADDPDDGVAALISRLLADEPLRNRVGAQARRSAEERFSFETRASKLTDLYREVVERNRSGRPGRSGRS
jgi:glycosyltransferase involved in cell wall biosynthesis